MKKRCVVVSLAVTGIVLTIWVVKRAVKALDEEFPEVYDMPPTGVRQRPYYGSDIA